MDIFPSGKLHVKPGCLHIFFACLNVPVYPHYVKILIKYKYLLRFSRAGRIFFPVCGGATFIGKDILTALQASERCLWFPTFMHYAVP
jgi:hypothetical protein